MSPATRHPFPGKLVLLHAAAAAVALPTADKAIVCLKAPAPKLDATKPLPERVKFLDWGVNQTTQGPVKVGAKTLATLAANQAKTGFTEVCIDFAHNTVESSPTYRGEPAVVAATHCKPEVVEGEGLFLLSANWTPQGREHAEHYPDLSAAVGLDEDGEVIFVHSGAVCRQGSVLNDSIRLFSASVGVQLDGLKKPAAGKDKGRKAPVVTTLAATRLDLDKLRTLLQLSAEATEADIAQAVEDALATREQADDAEEEDAPVTKKELKRLSARIDRDERERILAEARDAGRVVPEEWLPDAEGNGGLPVGQLRRLCATLPEIVPLSARTPAKLAGGGASGAVKALSAEQKDICRQLGVKEEDYLKGV